MSPVREEWLLVELYRENDQTHRGGIVSGLTEEEAKAKATEFNDTLRLFGVTGHWCEAVPDRSGS